MNRKFLAAIPAALLIAGCTLDPRAYESEPVVVQTAAGPVTCQLYTKEQVIWDRAIARPESMDVKTADSICLEEGRREKNGES